MGVVPCFVVMCNVIHFLAYLTGFVKLRGLLKGKSTINSSKAEKRRNVPRCWLLMNRQKFQALGGALRGEKDWNPVLNFRL
jgi:hypothetical protein